MKKNQFLAWILDDELEDHDFEKELLGKEGVRLVHSTARTFAGDYPVYAPRADAVLLQVSFRISAEEVAGLKRCRVISVLGAGYDNVPLEAAAMRGMWVATVPDYCVDEVSDHTMALLLALSRRIVRFDGEVRRGRWQPVQKGIHSLSGQTLGLVGFGRNARAVARKAQAFGLRVLACDPCVGSGEMAGLGVEKTELAPLLKRSDYVSVHVPLMLQTERLIGAKELAVMKKTAFLINTSRGGVIDEQALAEALRNGAIAGAALDVMDEEPPAPDNFLLKSGNTVITPHAAYYSEESLLRLRKTAAENVLRVLRGEQPQYHVGSPPAGPGGIPDGAGVLAV